jgi:predicted Zn finger-like uncharacterized protein
MRIVCPNCGAQYEIPNEMIPETGRDVQCSNCGQTWFQPDPSQPQAPLDGSDEDPDTAEQADWTEPEEPEEEPAEESPAQPRQRLSPQVASVLREEAEREARARADETGGGLETQPDLGLPERDDETRSGESAEQTARQRGDAPPEEPPAPATPGGIDPVSRRNLLPDIEEVDPAFPRAPEADRSDDGAARDGTPTAETAAARPGGFRTGVRLAVLLALFATAVYLLAPRISGTVPALSAPLGAYVETVDTWRVQLDGLVAELLAGTGTADGA